MKVTKFGGSSLASAPQLKKVLNIIKDDPERKFVVQNIMNQRSRMLYLTGITQQ